MASQNTLVYDLNPPRRPGIDDVGGGAKTDTDDPADTNTGLVAADWNQVSKLITALAKVCPLAVVSVKIVAGVPSIDSFACPTGNVSLGDFTVIDNGVGDTSVTLLAAKLPGFSTKPTVSLNGGSGGYRSPEAVQLTGANVGARVKTTDGAGAAVDVNFTMTWF